MTPRYNWPTSWSLQKCIEVLMTSEHKTSAGPSEKSSLKCTGQLFWCNGTIKLWYGKISCYTKAVQIFTKNNIGSCTQCDASICQSL